jgi:hypothetical protein
MPKRRNTSIVRAAIVLHFASGGSSAARGSSTITETPRIAASMARHVPTGPAPAITMVASISAMIVLSPMIDRSPGTPRSRISLAGPDNHKTRITMIHTITITNTFDANGWGIYSVNTRRQNCKVPGPQGLS